MRLGLLCIVVMIATLACSANAGTIKATGNADGIVQYNYTWNYNGHAPGDWWESYTVTSLAATSLPVQYVDFYTGPFGSETIWDYEPVFVFNILSLSGEPAPSNVRLWFYSPDNGIPYMRYYHSNVDLGGTVVEGYNPHKGNSTEIGTTGTPGPGWWSVDVTSQVAQDISHGFSHSTFSLGWATCHHRQFGRRLCAISCRSRAWLDPCAALRLRRTGNDADQAQEMIFCCSRALNNFTPSHVC